MTEREAIEWLKGCVVAYEVDNKGKPNGNVTCELIQEVIDMAISALEKQEVNRQRPCNEKPEYDFRNVLVRWHDKRKGCEKDYYIFEGYVVRGIWCGMFEDADISDFEPIEWKPLEPYKEEECD